MTKRQLERLPRSKSLCNGYADILGALLRDQSTVGYHKGQFGASVSLAESMQYGDAENMETKPRMYMTRWPCLVMKRHKLAPLAVKFAVENVRKLFVGGRILGRDAYTDARVDRPQRHICNFRHTMCGALLLLEQIGWNDTTRQVLGEMLDTDAEWQDPFGGWRGVSSRQTTDLFASLYAIRLLDATAMSPDPIREVALPGSAALERSLDYLESYWISSSWKFGELSAEETFPQAFIEICDVLRRRRPALYHEVVAGVLAQLNFTGGLSVAYKDKMDPMVSAERHHARLAYATFLAGQPDAIWGNLTSYALSGDLDRMYAAELAFMLDIVLAIRRADEESGSC